jgi:MarR family transcriptional regulator, organic hydroperoxide resistance regulator
MFGNDAKLTPMSASSAAIEEMFATASLGAPERAVGFVLWRVLHRYVREADRALSAFDMTHLQFQTLALAAWLSRGGETVTQSRIAQAGDVGPMQISHMMATLESKGWVRRSRSAADVRAKNVAVTDAGIEVLRRALPVMIDVQLRVFGASGSPGGALMEELLRIDITDP